jgi:hypothetical protein
MDGGFEINFSGGLLVLRECRLIIDRSKSRLTEGSYLACAFDEQRPYFLQPGESPTVLRFRPSGWTVITVLWIWLAKNPTGHKSEAVKIDAAELYGTFLAPPKE